MKALKIIAEFLKKNLLFISLAFVGILLLGFSYWTYQYVQLASNPNMYEEADKHSLANLAVNSYNKGIRDYRGGQYKSSAANLLACIALTPDNDLLALAYFALGNVQLKTDREDKVELAADLYAKALRLRPDFTDAKYNLERLYAFTKDKKGKGEGEGEGEGKDAMKQAPGDGSGDKDGKGSGRGRSDNKDQI